MAGRPQNRLELRRQYEAAEPPDPVEDETPDLVDADDDNDEEERKPRKKKAPAKPRATKTPKPAARMRVVWTVVNDAFKPIATFEFSKKDEALAKAAEMTAKGKGTHFVQKVKEPMPDDAPGLGASITREPVVAAPASTKAKAAVAEPIEDEEELDNDNDNDDENDTDSDDEFGDEDDDS